MDNLTETITEAASTADPEMGKVVSAISTLTFNEVFRTVVTLLIGIVIIRVILHSMRRITDRIQGADKTISGFLISSVRIILTFVLLIIVKFSSDMITKNCITNNVLENTDNVRILRVSMHCSCFPDSDDKRSVY